MRPGKEPKRRSRPSSPFRDRTKVPSGFEPRSPGSRSSVSVLDRELLADDIAGLEGLSISSDPSNSNPIPRSFPCSVKQQCWDKAEKIKGRDPFGNIVFRKLVGCSGCLCHDYDHILPYSKGGQSTLENCQVLQDPTHTTRSFDIVIPGSKIPAWFTRQSLEPSISIKLDGNNDWKGIAFSVCFRAYSSDDEFSCVCLQNGCYGLEFSFYANKSNKSCCGPCGVRLVYKEDIEELNEITLKNCNKSPEDEDEDGEHYSRSKRSKNQKGIFGFMLVAFVVASLVVALRHKSH